VHPVLIEIGPLVIRYYGLMYVIAFTVGLYLSWVNVRSLRLRKVRRSAHRERTLAGLRTLLERSENRTGNPLPDAIGAFLARPEGRDELAEAIDVALVAYLSESWAYRWNAAAVADLRDAIASAVRETVGVSEFEGDLFAEKDLVALARAIARGVLFVWDDAVDLLLWTIPGAILGARIYYVVFRWDVYRANPIDVVKIWEGGLAIHGGVLAGILVVYLFARCKRASFWSLTDVLVPSLILGQAIGRIGNLMNGDAFGMPTSLPWGIRFPAESPAGITYPGLATHPSMIYEMLLNLMIFGYLWAIRKRGYKPGFSTAMYFILYAVARSIVSFTRADSLWLGPFRAAHVISLVFVVAFGLLIWRRRLYERVPTA